MKKTWFAIAAASALLVAMPIAAGAQTHASHPTAKQGKGTPEAMYLTPKVKAALMADKQLDSTKINVDTMKGEVVLRGSVRSAAEKQHAAAVALKAMGDTKSKYKLVNQLTVSSGGKMHATGKH